MDSKLQDEFDELRRAQPSWRADGLGVSGNPVEFHKEQAQVNWPPAIVSHRGQGVDTGVSAPGAPEAPTTVTAT